MPDLPHVPAFELRVPERTLLVDGLPVDVVGRAFDVLVCLYEHGGRLVSKQVLLEAAWPGRVVEESNLSVQIAALRKLLGAPAIATVSGRGYRLAVLPRGDYPGPSHATDAGGPVASADGFESRFSIAVLPFEVLSDRPADAFLAEGLATDVITLLSRVPGFQVIARSSSFLFHGRSVNRTEVARQLSVRYLVEGNVRVRGQTVRVGATLIDAPSGHVLWCGTFESPRKQAEDLQEGIARGIISQLQPELTRAAITAIRRQRPENLNAWAHYHQAVGVIAEGGWSEASLERARSELRSAIAADPAFGLAHAHYAVLTTLGHKIGLVTEYADVCTWAASVEEALRLDDQNSEVLGYAGCALSDMGHHDHALELLRGALARDPSNAQSHVSLGAALALQGDLPRGIEALRFGMRISPRDRRLGFWGWIAAAFLLKDKRPEEALTEARMAQAHDPRLFLPRIATAVASMRTGQRQEAILALRRARELRPRLTLEEIAARHGHRAAAELGVVWALCDPGIPDMDRTG